MRRWRCGAGLVGVRGALAELELSGVDDLAGYLQANPSQLRRLASLVRIMDVNAAALEQVAAPPGRKDLARLTLAQNFDAAAMPNFARAVSAGAGPALLRLRGQFRAAGRRGPPQRTDAAGDAGPYPQPGLRDRLHARHHRAAPHGRRAARAGHHRLPDRPAEPARVHGRLQEEQGRLQRDIGACAAVLLLDIDHFKRINDEHGHAAGDAVLRQLADLMRESQRKIDMLGRIGGEEFAILLPGTDLDAAAVFGERLRQRVAQTPMQLDDGVTLDITVSIGIAAMGGWRRPAIRP
jgi:diguanylate cyclase (GGDEF)-like protein